MAPSVGLPPSLVDDVSTPDAARAAGRQSAPRSPTAASIFYLVRLVLWLLRWTSCQVLVASGLRVCCCVCHLTAAESTGAKAAASAEPDANLLLRQKQHHQKAFGFISKALRYDDEKHALKELAIVLYSKGIEELQKGIAIDFSQEKESMVKIEPMGNDPPWHADVARPPQGGQRLRAWQKTPPGQDAASANRDYSSWLKTAQNGRVAADGQSHDRPTSGDLKELAIGLYCKGIEDLQNGIAIDFSQGKGGVTTFVAH